MGFLRSLLASLLLFALLGCGGGGGDGDASGGGSGGSGGGGGGGGRTTSGLLPTAPAPGAVITADATLLRPVRDLATWTYRGVHIGHTGATPTAYVTSTSQAVSTIDNTHTTEAFTNAANDGPDAQQLVISGGTVEVVASLDFAGNGVFEEVRFTELRSPVRQGDQYTIWDRHYPSANIDVDGDGVPDALDVAIYARVMGVEAVQLSDVPSLSAVRVDVTLRTRAIASGDRQATAVIESTVQTWYARGIGIVRQRSVSPNASEIDVEIIDEHLTAWDGITEGFGAMATKPTAVPTSSPGVPGAMLPGGFSVRYAAVFGDHGLVVTASPFDDGGSVIARVDKLGIIVSARHYPSVRTNEGLLVTHGQGLLHLMQSHAAGSLGPTVDLTRFDTDGAMVSAAGAVSIDLTGSRTNPSFEPLQAAIDGTTLWLLWQRIYNAPTSQNRELILRPYTLDGVPLGPEIVVEAAATLAQRITSTGGRVLLSWQRFRTTYEAVYASVALGDANVVALTLTDGMVTHSVSTLRPLAGGGHGVLLWSAPLGDTPINSTAGARLDSSHAPVRAGPTLASEVLQDAPWIPNPNAIGSTPDRSQLVMSHDTVVRWIAMDTGMPLSQTPLHRVLLDDELVGDVFNHLVFADRVVLLGGDSFRLHTTVVWLNGGSAL
jgi:hypothetical protein